MEKSHEPADSERLLALLKEHNANKKHITISNLAELSGFDFPKVSVLVNDMQQRGILEFERIGTAKLLKPAKREGV